MNVEIEEKNFPIVENAKIIFQDKNVVLIEIETLRLYAHVTDVRDEGGSGDAICLEVVSYENGLFEKGDQQRSYILFPNYNCERWEVFSFTSYKESICLTLIDLSIN